MGPKFHGTVFSASMEGLCVSLGVLFFAAVVVLTMLAAESFDPRLLDPGKQPRRG
ncbi:MAG: hypothetical protein ACHBNF_09830 [Chromatiales bacterium]